MSRVIIDEMAVGDAVETIYSDKRIRAAIGMEQLRWALEFTAIYFGFMEKAIDPVDRVRHKDRTSDQCVEIRQ